MKDYERRLRRLEAAKDAKQPERGCLTFLAALPDEAQEAELNWIIPLALRTLIRGGEPGYPRCDGAGGLADHPDVALLWAQWHDAYQRVSQQAFLAWWNAARGPGDLNAISKIACPAPFDFYNFWSARQDEEQEQLRAQLVERLRGQLPEPCRAFLTEWQPSSPEACGTRPSPVYFRWIESREEAGAFGTVEG